MVRDEPQVVREWTLLLDSGPSSSCSEPTLPEVIQTCHLRACPCCFSLVVIQRHLSNKGPQDRCGSRLKPIWAPLQRLGGRFEEEMALVNRTVMAGLQF